MNTELPAAKFRTVRVSAQQRGIGHAWEPVVWQPAAPRSEPGCSKLGLKQGFRGLDTSGGSVTVQHCWLKCWNAVDLHRDKFGVIPMKMTCVAFLGRDIILTFFQHRCSTYK